MWTYPGRAEAGRLTVTNSDGALVNADAGCAGVMFYDGVSDASTVTVTSDAVGKYKWSVTVSDVAVPGTRAEVQIAATVNSISTADVFLVGRVVPSDRWKAVMSDTDEFDVNVTTVADASVAESDAATIADAVWDESLTSGSHNTANTAGKYVSDTMDFGTPPTAASIADAVWDEDIGSGNHATANTAAKYLSDAIDDTSNLQSSQGDWATATGFSTHQASDVASDVWNSLLAAHVGAGTFGSDIQLLPESDSIANAVWDESLTSGSHAGANTAGKYVSDMIDDTADLQANQGNWTTATGFSTHVSSDVASDVWNSLQAAHVGAGTFGKVVSDVLEEVDGLDGAAMRGTDSAYTGTPPTSDAIADAVWDEVLTGAVHNDATSAGRRLREITASVTHSGTAQGGAATYITLDAGASATDGAYDPSVVAIISGTGAGQARLIMEYNGTSKAAYVDRNWKTNPDATSEFVIFADPGREHTNEGVLTAATSTTADLNSLASATDDTYNGQWIFVRAGTGEDQVRRITDYDGTNQRVTVDPAWTTTPSTDSIYAILPNACTKDVIADAVWDEAMSGHVAAGSAGKYISDMLDDTDELQTNQGNWVTATGFSTHVSSDVASDVWNSLKAAHTTEATFGAYLNSDVQTAIDAGGGSAPTAAAIADAVWDEDIGSGNHATANTPGKYISDIIDDVTGLAGAAMRGTDSAYTGTPPTAAAIADAVWDEDIGSGNHATADTPGKYVSDIRDEVDGLAGAAMRGTDSALLAAQISDVSERVLKQSVSDVEDDAALNSLATLIQAGLESRIVGSDWTIYKTDGSTTMQTRQVTSDADGDPITRVQ